MPRKIIDLTNETYGKLKVIRLLESGTNKKTLWECQCECGKTINLTSAGLRSGYYSSCGCTPKNKGLVGEKFGKLKVLRKVSPDEYNLPKRNAPYWECECECGNIKIFSGTALKHTKTLSCGCYSKQYRELRNELKTIPDLIAKKDLFVTNTSGCKGVSFNKTKGKYHAYLGFQGKRYNLGYHSTLEEAIEARRLAEDRIYGDFLDWYNKEIKPTLTTRKKYTKKDS